ncbi:F-BAR and double SH3 domains protein 2 [Copidosoma floridanum]|uniref:F-BAR and double SH3 domains protein 2 n=1 Tax=Copidosoma floridanum TaxID=29053 RepID=UPI000C6F468A|nr:F-BAR and double SH3 domains protein 2 [Copidosoma floridanum]
MQPPPRKGNYAKFLKNVHSEQAAKLLLKNQHECDILEDIRTFLVKRSAIEKSYADALLKISSAYLNKKILNIPDLKVDNVERWNMWNVWRTVLEENEKIANARLAAVEVFQTRIADEIKVLKMHKVQIAKKAVDQLMTVQKELQTCVQDVDKTKKLYFDEEHSAHDVRDKAKDIEEKYVHARVLLPFLSAPSPYTIYLSNYRLKKKKGSFFQSITSLQKNSAKVSSKRDQLEEKSTGARNDYLLALAAANAHQIRYFSIDLQTAMQTMEQGVFDKIADYLSIMARTELLTCAAINNSFTTVNNQVSQLTREYNLQCLYLYFPVLKQHIQYDFEPCDNDQVERITVDNAAAQTLTKEARRWATKIAREINTYNESKRKLKAYQQMRESGQKTDPNDPNGPDLETKMEEMRQAMRKAETAKMKAEARIECLRKGGVNVEEFLQEVDTLSVSEMPRSASSLSLKTDASGNVEQPSSDSFYDSDNDAGSDLTTVERPGRASAAGHHDEDSGAEERQRNDSAEVDALLEAEKQKIDEITAGWDDPTTADWGNDETADEVTTSNEIRATTGVAPIENIYKCTALYSYTAQNPDELSIVESEQLEVVGEGDGDGWLRARNYRGEEGFVPQNYLDIEQEAEPQQSGLVSQSPGIVQQISFSSVDYTVDDHDAVDPDAHLHQQQQEQEQLEQAQKEVPTHREATVVVESAVSPVPPVAPQSNHVDDGREYCIAMYDYEATCEEELSFMEGDVIVVLKKEPHDVDDGWWEGEFEGQKGLFPSLVVEPCAPDGTILSDVEDDVTPPSTSAPPVFTPPDAPEFVLNEELAKSLMNEMRERGFVNGDRPDSFDMNLTKGQKNQYGLQFDSEKDTPQAPGIIIDEAPDESSDKEDENGDVGLGVAQIVITAATPMEEPDRPFPGTEPTETPEEQEQQPSIESEKTIEPEKASEPQILEEEEEEVESAPPPQSDALKKAESEEKMIPDDQPTDSAPFPVSSSSGSDAESVSGPSTGDNSQCLPAARSGGPAAAPAEDQPAEQSPPAEPPSGKMLVGGRASIPDELQPDQLQKLQDLKESNA